MQMQEYVEEKSLLNDSQSGFRPNRNTTSTLIGLTDEIRKCSVGNKCCVLLSLDLEKAFERIDHAILVEKLFYMFRFSSSACNLRGPPPFSGSKFLLT